MTTISALNNSDLKGSPQLTSMKAPLVTIITIVYNGDAFLEKTIKSVVAQSYATVEYIIIDGGSKDGTLNIIQKYADHIHYWLSEADKGIYDAMNKGIKAATGEWINFMNAGDVFHAPDVLEQLFEDAHPNIDILCGQWQMVGANQTKKKHPQPATSFWKGLPYCHQTAFVRRTALMQHPFDTSYKIAADFKQHFSIYKQGGKVKNIAILICDVDDSGISNAQIVTSVQEKLDILQQLESQPSLMQRLYYSLRLFYLKFLKS